MEINVSLLWTNPKFRLNQQFYSQFPAYLDWFQINYIAILVISGWVDINFSLYIIGSMATEKFFFCLNKVIVELKKTTSEASTIQNLQLF